jgi:cytochrome bd-type quinol oxidase subunit 1
VPGGAALRAVTPHASTDAKIFQTLRNPAEIQRAHDLIGGVITNPSLHELVFHANDAAALAAVMVNMEVLCWVLGHDRNQTFSRNYTAVEAALAELGILLADSGALRRREDPKE